MSKKLATCLVIGASVLLIGNNLSAKVGEPWPAGWPSGTGGPEDFMSGTINGETVYYTNDQKKCPNCGVVPDDVAKLLPNCPKGSCWTPTPVPLQPSSK